MNQTKLDNFKFQAQLKLTFENLGFLSVMLAVAVLGAAPAVALGYVLL